MTEQVGRRGTDEGRGIERQRLPAQERPDRSPRLPHQEDPGGDIFIHGLPNGWRKWRTPHGRRDWTAGCIAVTDAEIREVWSLVPTGAAVRIHP